MDGDEKLPIKLAWPNTKFIIQFTTLHPVFNDVTLY